MINERSKLAPKRVHDLAWLGAKGDLLGIVKRWKFDHINEWYMHKPVSMLENEIQKILWGFEIQMDQTECQI